jgi:hypothetical protein
MAIESHGNDARSQLPGEENLGFIEILDTRNDIRSSISSRSMIDRTDALSCVTLDSNTGGFFATNARWHVAHLWRVSPIGR